MKKLFLLLISAFSLAGQSLPWNDLSGSWRMIEGDNPAYAQPDFDDSRWNEVELPGGNIFVRGGPPHFLWMRRTIELPTITDGRHLALTLGKLTENYRVYIKGRLAGSVGGFTQTESQIARPRTFDLPPIDVQPTDGRRIVIALRVWGGDFFGSLAWQTAVDTGPYLLTAAANAPIAAGPAFIDRIRLSRTLDFGVGVALVTLGLILLLMYLNRRSRPELLWLALHSGAVAVRRLQVVLLITADAKPWKSVTNGLIELHMALLIEFVMAALSLRSRWIRVAIWSAVAIACTPFPLARIVPFRALEALSVGVLVWAARKCSRTPAQYFIVGASALVFLAGARGDLAPKFFDVLPTATVRLGPYSIGPHSVVTAFFTLFMVLILTRRLLEDSAERQRMSGEFEAARAVQSLLLSHTSVSTGEYAIEVAYQPAQEVGGDFYWTQQTGDGALLCAVGDVSGKGLKAAMRVSQILGYLRSYLHAAPRLSPATILSELNAALAGDLEGGFVTCCCLRFDPGGRVTLANAGHVMPWLGGVEIQAESGLPLAIAAEVTWIESELYCPPADAITIVSDGVIEAANGRGELFGFDQQAVSARSLLS